MMWASKSARTLASDDVFLEAFNHPVPVLERVRESMDSLQTALRAVSDVLDVVFQGVVIVVVFIVFVLGYPVDGAQDALDVAPILDHLGRDLVDVAHGATGVCKGGPAAVGTELKVCIKEILAGDRPRK
jgi:hypothetical protein